MARRSGDLTEMGNQIQRVKSTPAYAVRQEPGIHHAMSSRQVAALAARLAAGGIEPGTAEIYAARYAAVCIKGGSLDELAAVLNAAHAAPKRGS